MNDGERALWRTPSFRSYFTARTISSFGSTFGTLAVTFAALEGGLGTTGLGIVLAASTIPSAVFLVGGVVGDRLPRRLILASTDLVMGTVQIMTAVLAFGTALAIPELAGRQFIRGMAYAFFAPASTGMLPEIVGESPQKANSTLNLTRNFAFERTDTEA